MKITGFCPLIVTREAEAAIKLFEALGFERVHTKTDIEGGQNTNYNMKDPGGNRVSIASSNHVPQDLMAMNINVDDFDEAYDFLIDHGFRNTRGDRITRTSSSEDTYLVAPSGFAIVLTHHIRKEAQQENNEKSEAKEQQAKQLKITTFSPLIVSKDADNIVKLFEELGFERCHKNDPTETISDNTMKDAAGHQVDIAEVDTPKDIPLIRMNVDDFDKALELLKSHGFENKSGRIVESESSKSAMIVSPTGFGFDLCHHKK